ncbi:MAG: DUF2147 domain-containing protein [Acidobacteriota bacterium]|nr:DUF2147 domain-containing protein [Acidobacteriota bacterium]
MKATLRNCALACMAAALTFAGAGTLRAQQLNDKLQKAVGHWQVINNEGKPWGKVDTYLVDGKLYGKVTELRPGRQPNDMCEKCSGELKNKPLMGLVIIRNFHPGGDDWVGGTVIDPENGKEYKGKLWSVGDGKLSMRGYIGISMLGRTENWVRLK